MGNAAEQMPTPVPQEGFTPEEEAWFNSHPEAIAKMRAEAMKKAFEAAQKGMSWEDVEKSLE